MKITEQRAELRSLGVEELKQRARDLDDLVFRLRLQKSMGQTESANKMQPLRRQLARIKTVLGEKGVRE